jgi:hypothetical protein
VVDIWESRDDRDRVSSFKRGYRGRTKWSERPGGREKSRVDRRGEAKRNPDLAKKDASSPSYSHSPFGGGAASTMMRASDNGGVGGPGWGGSRWGTTVPSCYWEGAKQGMGALLVLFTVLLL